MNILEHEKPIVIHNWGLLNQLNLYKEVIITPIIVMVAIIVIYVLIYLFVIKAAEYHNQEFKQGDSVDVNNEQV